MRRFWVLVFFLSALAGNIFAQGNVEFIKENFSKNKRGLRKALINIKRGDKFHKDGIYNDALIYYEVAQEINPNNVKLNYAISKCNMELRDFEAAVLHAEKAFDLEDRKSREKFFYKGWACQLRHQFDSAIVFFNKYLNVYNTTSAISALDEKRQDTSAVYRHILECEFGKKLMQNPILCEIDNLGATINTDADEYNPVVSIDGKTMYYTVREKRGRLSVDGRPYEEVYVSNRVSDLSWGKGTWLRALNSSKSNVCHSSVQWISDAGDKLILYKSEVFEDLYSVEIKHGKYSRPQLMAYANSPYHEASACYAREETILFFCSDKASKDGNHDIYKTVLDESTGKWSEPESLGDVVNSSKDERFVYALPDGNTLFFSSNGHLGMGGYDVFRTTYVDGEWTEPENVGYPINSPSDDLCFAFKPEENMAYYASSRLGGHGKHDIYKATMFESILEAKKELPLVEEQPEEKDTIVKHDTVVVEKVIILKDTVEKTIEPEYERGIILEVLFDFDKPTLRKESETELNKLYQLMVDNPNIKVEISGHTDNKGSAAYNKKLSAGRAKSVVDYLIQKGISPNRLTSVGYGLERPIAPNTTEEGRQKNRRAEYRIISE